MYYLSLDIGTTGGKVLLFTPQMQMVQVYQADYKTYHNDTGEQAEHDPDDWWRVCREGIRSVLSREAIGGGQIAAIGLSCMTPVVLPVDSDGTPLSRAWLWYDRRGAGMLAHVHNTVSPEEQELLFGTRCKEVSFLPKLLYLRETMPSVYAQTAAFLQANGYLIQRLTGRVCMDSSHGELLHLVQMDTGRYSERMLQAFSLDAQKLPPLIHASDIAGYVTQAAADETGLAPGVPVICGGHDSALSAYALGLRAPGRACLDIGNAVNLVMANDRPVHCAAADVYRHPEPGKWLFQIYSATAGAALRWCRDVFGAPEMQEATNSGISVYDLLCRTAKQSKPGAGGVLFLPYLQGAQQCSELSGSFQGLRLQNSRADMIRALLEGCAMSVRYNAEQMQQASGLVLREVVACGGGARSALWVQIFADVLGCDVLVSDVKDAAGTGAAMLACAATGAACAERAQMCHTRVQPNAQTAQIYHDVYARFRAQLEQQIRACEYNCP